MHGVLIDRGLEVNRKLWLQTLNELGHKHLHLTLQKVQMTIEVSGAFPWKPDWNTSHILKVCNVFLLVPHKMTKNLGPKLQKSSIFEATKNNNLTGTVESAYKSGKKLKNTHNYMMWIPRSSPLNRDPVLDYIYIHTSLCLLYDVTFTLVCPPLIILVMPSLPSASGVKKGNDNHRFFIHQN
ncbi:unnamed protein product [Lactuca saligna]|uniref:Uncharacterized protein n=1 Tax=Lactuca saligna TaxID=75948 RepID=A0AA35Z651_LACSI|nr:unnamed protein product [Lactuca saligna]